MGDPDNRHAKLLAQLFYQLKDLGLDRHVERRCRLVRDQNLGVASQSNRDHHALTHAARELVRIILKPPFRVGNAHKLQQFDRAATRGLLVQPHVLAQRLHQLETDVEHRVEGGHRILEHHPDPGAANGAQLVFTDLHQVAVAEQNLALADLGGRHRQQADERHHGDGFARTGLPHNTEQLPGFQPETDVIDGMDFAPAGAEHCLQITNVQYVRIYPCGHLRIGPIGHMQRSP
mmetsp:Transcript_260/g.402  ORF Transcript_260/g.402 Transcript_260/m.402 type:complete len:233 (+) Transcript_260:238-936(+)